MGNSLSRKLALSGWLQRNDYESYDDPLKLQKFLFIYEALSKASGDPFEFDDLQGWRDGPVFGRVWGNYRHRRHEFDEVANAAYATSDDTVSVDRAKQVDFILRSLARDELSELTHEFNIWSAQREKIEAGDKEVILDESDFDWQDLQLCESLEWAYPLGMVESCDVYAARDFRFIIPCSQVGRFVARHWTALDEIAATGAEHGLHNPVYIQIDEEGDLLVD